MIIIMMFLGVLDCVDFCTFIPLVTFCVYLDFVLYSITVIDNNHNTVDCCKPLKLNYFVAFVNIYM